MILRLGLALSILFTGSASWAGPMPVICIRDTKDDSVQIRRMFDQVDRMATRDLRQSNIHFYVDSGFVPIDVFVILSNFHDGRQDETPLRITGIRLLQFSGEPRPDAFYVVGTKRSEWFDRGADSQGGYTDVTDTWLVGFTGCHIDSVREAPGLYYLLEGAGNG